MRIYFLNVFLLILHFTDALTDKLVSKAYYLGEVENELRRIELTSHVFNDNHLEDVMDMIDDKRHSSIYRHKCTEYCKVKGML